MAEYWENYLLQLKEIDQPAYNVMSTVRWEIKDMETILLTFDSESMAVEFENLRDDFILGFRQKVNNYYVQVDKKINRSKVVKKHIKSRVDIYQEMVAEYPALDFLREKLDLDIENEPK